MMEYFIDYTEKAIKGLLRLRDSEPKAYAKAQKLKFIPRLAQENLNNLGATVLANGVVALTTVIAWSM